MNSECTQQSYPITVIDVHILNRFHLINLVMCGTLESTYKLLEYLLSYNVEVIYVTTKQSVLQGMNAGYAL